MPRQAGAACESALLPEAGHRYLGFVAAQAAADWQPCVRVHAAERDVPGEPLPAPVGHAVWDPDHPRGWGAKTDAWDEQRFPPPTDDALVLAERCKQCDHLVPRHAEDARWAVNNWAGWSRNGSWGAESGTNYCRIESNATYNHYSGTVWSELSEGKEPPRNSR